MCVPAARHRSRLARRAAHLLAVAMSALRRNNACCRAPLYCATPPPISASSQPVRNMNPQLQRRISLVLRRAHWFSVLHFSQCSMVVPSRLSDAPPYAHSLCDPLLKPKRSDRSGKLANDQDRLIQIQIPQSRGAASFKSLYLKRPYTAHRKRKSSPVGASDTALRLLARVVKFVPGITSGRPRQVRHAYTRAGEFTVKLVVQGVDGIAAQKSVSIPVQGNVVLQRPTRYEPVK